MIWKGLIGFGKFRNPISPNPTTDQNWFISFNPLKQKEWDEEPDGGKEFEFTPAENRLITKMFSELDSRAQVPTDPKFIILYRKFIH